MHQTTRLRILATLHRNRELSFNQLRDVLGLTDGNLGSHGNRLIEAGYIATRHAVTPRRIELRYRLTVRGTEALLGYVAALRELLEGKDSDADAGP